MIKHIACLAVASMVTASALGGELPSDLADDIREIKNEVRLIRQTQFNFLDRLSSVETKASMAGVLAGAITAGVVGKVVSRKQER